MKREKGIRAFALLCAVLLLLPAACAGRTFDCDACGASGEPKARRLNDETINGETGYWVEYVCAKCGARLPGMAKAWVRFSARKAMQEKAKKARVRKRPRGFGMGRW